MQSTLQPVRVWLAIGGIGAICFLVLAHEARVPLPLWGWLSAVPIGAAFGGVMYGVFYGLEVIVDGSVNLIAAAATRATTMTRRAPAPEESAREKAVDRHLR